MTLRLVLASAPVSAAERYGHFAGAGSTEPSFGLLCLAAVAREAGSAVAVVEASARALTPEQATREILAFQPDMVGFTATTSEIVASAALAQSVRQARPQALTVVGGCHVTALPDATLNEFPAFDMAVVGEGEYTLRDLLQHHAPGTMPPALPGTATWEGGAVRVHPPRPLIESLDTLPRPAWDLLPGFPHSFRPSPARVLRWPCASVVLTRGCPNQCTFCDRSVFGHRCRSYSPAYAVDLVRELRERFGVRELLIEDDTFVLVRKHVAAFCERLLSQGVDLTWSCLGRADRVDPDLLRLMRSAGCWHISFGVESGDADILNAMHKRLDLEQLRQAVAWSREAGLRTKGFFIVGFPGETRDTLRRTREFACSLPLDDISVMQMTPFPGSELYAMADRYGVFERDWRRMNVVNTVFVPHGFTAADMEAARARLLRDFYLRPRVLARYAAHVLRHPALLGDIGRGLGTFLRRHEGPGMRITVITPSFNQGRYIERTIRSVVEQTGDFELEYWVLDGGSTDETVPILRRWEGRLRWVSERDGGQSDALNRGLGRATGDILAWLNSDDMYAPGALAAVAAAYRESPFLWCFGDCRIVDENDREIRAGITRYKVWQSRRYSYRRLLRRDFIPQPSTFFTRAAWQKAGEIDRTLVYSMDYDYWLRLGRMAPPRYLPRFLADFRWHTASKNGARYRRAAWETYQTARRHAPPGSAVDLFLHGAHLVALSVLYRFL